MHIIHTVYFIPNKFHIGFRGIELTKCSKLYSSYISAKRAKFPQKIMESEFPCNMHIVPYIPTKIYEILCSGLTGVAFTKQKGDAD